MRPLQTITAVLRSAIQKSDESYYAIAKATGIDKAALGRFMAGRQSMRLDIADKLATYLGLVLVMKES